MIIGYARVSTQAQDAALQLDALKAAGCSRVYEEKASGASKNRPELAHCLASLREGDTLAVWRLDRLGRSLKDLVQIVSDLEAQNINFKSVTESIDTSSPSGKLIFHLFCSLAEFERRLIQERTQAGLKAARARGRLGGRPLKLSAADLQKARAMLADTSQTVKEVARHFGVTRATLYRGLARQKKE